MLEGIRVKTIDRFIDERGYFTELMRKDWTDLFAEDKIAQINHSFTYPNIIRAWHRHLRGQVDYFLALKGTIKIGVYDDESCELDEIVSSGTKLRPWNDPAIIPKIVNGKTNDSRVGKTWDWNLSPNK